MRQSLLKNRLQALFIMVITILGVASLVMIDRSQVGHWRAEKVREIQAKAQLCQIRLENSITLRFDALESLASLFVLHPDTTPEEFTHFASLLLKSHPPIRAIQYADRHTRVTYVYPPKGNEVTISNPMHLLSDPLRGPYVKKAIDQKKTVLQGPFELRQSGMGVVVRLPIFKKDSFIGLAIGVYDLNILINESLSGIDLKEFSLQMADDSGHVFWGNNTTSNIYVKKYVSMDDVKWFMTLSYVKSPDYPPGPARLLIWTFGLGFLVTSVLLFIFLSSQASRLEKKIEDRTTEIAIANAELVDKIAKIGRAEESLRESEERFRKIIELSGAGYFFIDREGRFREVNTSWLQMHGYASKNEILGQHFAITQIGQDLEDTQRKIEKLLDGSPVPSDEGSRLCKDGSIGYHTFTISPVENRGEIIGLEGFVIDITKRKLAEEERSRLKLVLEGLWEITRLADEDYKVIYDNILEEILYMTRSEYAFYGFIDKDETKMEIYSWSKEAKAGCRIKEQPLHFPIENAGLLGEAVRRRQALIHNDYHADQVGKLGLPEGHVIIDRLATVPIFLKNRIIAVAAVANKPNDYTEDDLRQIETFAANSQILIDRKKAQDQIKASLKEKEILLKEIHHRVKNNMQSISSLLNIQANKVKDERVKEALRAGIHRIGAMAAAHEATYQSDTLTDIRLRSYLESLIDRIMGTFSTVTRVPTINILVPSNITLPTKIAAPFGLALNEVIVNALKYAFPAGHGGPTITIEGSLVEDQINLAIKDNGVGLPDDLNLDKIETMGLFLVKSLIEQQLGGTVRIKSGGGTQVVIRCPVKTKA